ncbi:probable protein phosphatase 2C 13 [Impatiens glandulifera]|uniref:probable protein phosphatase 2C 13 n=1 Tax=Impatiens glandulifera TaxID=253017 RepID=UPI001FB119DF|nr:probable protein phosphatase 2C 13 [Impatiens glandulifera]
MIVGQNVVAETEIYCQQNSISVLDVQYICVPKATSSPIEHQFLEVSTTLSPKQRLNLTHEFQSPDLVSLQISAPQTVQISENNVQSTIMEPTSTTFLPSICSGSHTDIGSRASNEDEHIRIDDLSSHMGYLFGCKLPSSFYAVFDGHGGSNAATYLKNNSIKIFFEDMDMPQTSEIDELFLKKLEVCHQKAFLSADRALSDEQISPSSCGTTALTALILGRLLMVANAGDSRAVLCRKGLAVQLSQDHRPDYLPERKRVEDLGGFIEYGYLNGELAVTRALGDWYLKAPFVSSSSPLTAEPEIQQIVLREDEDEFLIIACDGIWDVLSSQDAVSLVRLSLRRHGDPTRCAQELVKEAIRVNAGDNLTAIVVCFSLPVRSERPRFRFCVSEESRNKLRDLLEGK